MIEDIFSYILLAVIFIGGIWGIYIKTKDFSNFVKKSGWRPVRKKIQSFFVRIWWVVLFTLIGVGYFSGFALIISIFSENENYANTFILAYLFLGFFILYYVQGSQRRKTKNINTIFTRDILCLRDGFKDFIKGIWFLVEALLVLAGRLFVFVAVIGLIALGTWLLIAIGPLWIIAVVLILILISTR